ncbi:unnamed protein product [Paramecium sonneborni]|uniref:Uncharacterized protein n=1 Tax=Paramecium sonneborni TaxID=65129 RepID=A0A8S1RRY5_9CILI|nr:unnamed protein product [Paramecium sonneborni]
MKNLQEQRIIFGTSDFQIILNKVFIKVNYKRLTTKENFNYELQTARRVKIFQQTSK